MMVRNSNRGYGYVLGVDVKYPRELHDLHNDLPFMCEKIKVNPNQYGGALWPPYSFSLISPERLELRPSNFLTFSFCLLAIRKM